MFYVETSILRLTCFGAQEETNDYEIEKDEEGHDDPGKCGPGLVVQLRSILCCKDGPTMLPQWTHIIHGGAVIQASALLHYLVEE